MGITFLGILIGLIIVFRRSSYYNVVVANLLHLPEHYKNSILKYNNFYRHLPSESKQRFEKKVFQFIRTKQFIPRNVSSVTDEMKALIASSAVQLTFGLEDVSLKHFDKILVYPDNYYSSINQTYHKGEVNPRLKAIVVSWRAFVEGYAEPHNGINLGLHEMAHALKLENVIQNGEHNFFDPDEYNKWLALAKDEISKIREGKESLFRSYASSDEDEFFATGMEVYFEQPHKLFDYNPELYQTLSNLLNQDTRQLYEKPSI